MQDTLHWKAASILAGLLVLAFLVPFIPPPACPYDASCAAPPRLRSLSYTISGVGSVIDEYGRYDILGLPFPVVVGTVTSETYSGGTSTYYEPLCVKAGEPLYPSTQLIPLATFAQEWGSQYHLSLFYSNSTVVVSSQTHVGSSSLRTVAFILQGC